MKETRSFFIILFRENNFFYTLSKVGATTDLIGFIPDSENTDSFRKRKRKKKKLGNSNKYKDQIFFFGADIKIYSLIPLFDVELLCILYKYIMYI
jgi:hypothetical protein